jgi:hypothetical protein
MNNAFFHHWVANTVANLGGNRAACLQAMQRECALTSFETRMDACQGVFEVYFPNENLYSMRDTVIVTTNKRVLH